MWAYVDFSKTWQPCVKGEGEGDGSETSFAQTREVEEVPRNGGSGGRKEGWKEGRQEGPSFSISRDRNPLPPFPFLFCTFSLSFSSPISVSVCRSQGGREEERRDMEKLFFFNLIFHSLFLPGYFFFFLPGGRRCVLLLILGWSSEQTLLSYHTPIQKES